LRAVEPEDGGWRLSGDPNGKKLAELDAHIKSAQAENAPPARTNEGKGWSLGAEFVGGVLVGAGIGWFLDKWLHTKPWLFIGFMILGFVVGTVNALRYGKNIDRPDLDEK
jgi:ATP synthase protein I